MKTATPELPWLKDKMFKTLFFFKKKKRGKGEQADGEGVEEGGATGVGPEERTQSSAHWMGISAGTLGHLSH